MRKEAKKLKAASLIPNLGQIEWLPKNPRQWKREDIERTAKSIKEDPDFLEDRPLLVTPKGGSKWIVFAGNLRHAASKSIGLTDLPCVVYYPETEEDEMTIKRRAMKDNGSFGEWDFDILANEWDDLPLVDFGIPAWGVTTEMNLSAHGRDGDEEYNEFVDKFKQKLTTDDCYTPPAVYDAVLKFVGTLTPMAGRKVVRPFFPGGNYEDLAQYPKGSVVVDNPPFSLMSSIIRFYCKNGIPFFVFAPALTLFSATDCDVTYIISDSDIVYENGARVRTGFITNLIPDVRIWCCPSLREMIDDAQPDEDKTKQGFVYPDNIVTAAILGKITKRSVELKIRKVSCEPIRDSDSAKEQGRGLFGGGFIMSDRAAAERAAAERAAATRLNLSAREKQIIDRLNKQDV